MYKVMLKVADAEPYLSSNLLKREEALIYGLGLLTSMSRPSRINARVWVGVYDSPSHLIWSGLVEYYGEEFLGKDVR